MKTYIQTNLASPQIILKWTERILPDGRYIGKIEKSLRISKIYFNISYDSF